MPVLETASLGGTGQAHPPPPMTGPGSCTRLQKPQPESLMTWSLACASGILHAEAQPVPCLHASAPLALLGLGPTLGGALARRLEAHPCIRRVHYPGLRSHPDYAIAAQQMQGCGGVVSFEVEGDLWDTARVIDSVRLPYIAPSLGGVETLIEQPTVISYWDQARTPPRSWLHGFCLAQPPGGRKNAWTGGSMTLAQERCLAPVCVRA